MLWYTSNVNVSKKFIPERKKSMGLFDKIFGTYSDRELKDIKPIVNKI